MKSLDRNWWATLVTNWNENLPCDEPIQGDIAITTSDTSVTLRFDRHGQCTLTSVSDRAIRLRFAANTDVWHRDIVGHLPVERAVLTDEIQFSGTWQELVASLQGLKLLLRLAATV